MKNVEETVEDPICKQWLIYCLSSMRHEAGGVDCLSSFYEEKDKFYEDNEEHLRSHGFEHYSVFGQCKKFAKEIISISPEERENEVYVVKLGAKEHPATSWDIDAAWGQLKELLGDLKPIKVLIAHHAIDISKASMSEVSDSIGGYFFDEEATDKK